MASPSWKAFEDVFGVHLTHKDVGLVGQSHVGAFKSIIPQHDANHVISCKDGVKWILQFFPLSQDDKKDSSTFDLVKGKTELYSTYLAGYAAYIKKLPDESPSERTLLRKPVSTPVCRSTAVSAPTFQTNAIPASQVEVWYREGSEYRNNIKRERAEKEKRRARRKQEERKQRRKERRKKEKGEEKRKKEKKGEKRRKREKKGEDRRKRSGWF
jgi:hypothetical protein